MYSYNDDHGRLPPAVVYGKDGRPLHSWRVLLLPYIDQEKLYKEFKLDEPWDSAHNIQLLPKMPRTYAPPGRKKEKIPPHHTVIHVFVGPGAAFEGAEGTRIPDDFTDGQSNTLLIVEAGEPVPWTKPEDFPYGPDQPLPELRGIFKDGFRVCMGDASRRWVRNDLSEKSLRALITRNGGDMPGSDW